MAESSEVPQIEAPPGNAPEVECSLTIGKAAAELYPSWRAPQNLRRIMERFDFAEVSPMGDDSQHWRVSMPLRQSLEWNA
ncbi:MAG: cyclase [Nitrosospira multiformis]|nr:cyclase [Nitrosospira multiformis]